MLGTLPKQHSGRAPGGGAPLACGGAPDEATPSTVEQVVKLFGIVASAPEFKQQHIVLNGCSDVMMAVLGGERGYHARSAIGTNTLPLDSPVEVEAIITVKPA